MTITLDELNKILYTLDKKKKFKEFFGIVDKKPPYLGSLKKEWEYQQILDK